MMKSAVRLLLLIGVSALFTRAQQTPIVIWHGMGKELLFISIRCRLGVKKSDRGL
jgi:hypothetical protein